jgi:hypothetical protein
MISCLFYENWQLSNQFRDTEVRSVHSKLSVLQNIVTQYNHLVGNCYVNTAEAEVILAMQRLNTCFRGNE